MPVQNQELSNFFSLKNKKLEKRGSGKEEEKKKSHRNQRNIIYWEIYLLERLGLSLINPGRHLIP